MTDTANNNQQPKGDDANLVPRTPKSFQIKKAGGAGKRREIIGLYGKSGHGKTTLASTYPGRSLFLFFDLNGPASLHGTDHDYVEFIPAAKGVGFGGREKQQKLAKTPDAYDQFAAFWVEVNQNPGMLDGYDNIILDSYTSFQNALMQKIIEHAALGDNAWEFSHWGMLARKAESVIRGLTSLDKNVIIILHEKEGQDGDLGKYLNISGSMQKTLVTLLSHLFYCEAKQLGKEFHYRIKTKPDGRHGDIKTAYLGLEAVENVTIKDLRNRQDSGFAQLLKKAR